ncbi:MAG: hypothetical protein WEC75_12090 [Dehalococcoidia bacterium]
MDVIREVQERIAKYPQAQVRRSLTHIEILPVAADGFSVSLRVAADRFGVSYEGWHEDFDDPTEALDCLAFGLSDACRLKVCSRGGFDYKWTLESRESGDWVEDSTTGLLLFPFWRSARVRYLQNRLISADS